MGNKATNSEIQHHRFLGEVKILHSHDRDFLQVNFPMSDQIRSWKVLKDDFRPHKTLFLPCSEVTNSPCCGSGFIEVCFQYFPITLEEEVNHRRQSGQQFQEEELWFILWALAQAGNALHRQGMRLADVQPNSILADYSGQLRVVCEATLPNLPSSVDKIRMKMLKSYVAPEELQRMGTKEGLRESETTQAFSIGMALLHISLLKACFDVYDYQEALVRMSLLANRIKQLQQTAYSSSFKEIMKALLQPDPRHRMTTYELFKKLEPYAKEIQTLCEFDMDTIPSKSGATIFNFKSSKIKLSCRSTGTEWKAPSVQSEGPSSPNNSSMGKVEEILSKLQAKIDQRLRISKQLLLK